MMNCQAPRRPYRVSQMTTIFITLLCFPSFLGASVCVTYTMWRYAHKNTNFSIEVCQTNYLYTLQTSMHLYCMIDNNKYKRPSSLLVSFLIKCLLRVLCEQFDTFRLSSVFSITPSTSCGPFRELKTMFQAGKRWVEELEKDNPNLSPLAWAHSYLVEHPFFLFVGAGIFL